MCVLWAAECQTKPKPGDVEPRREEKTVRGRLAYISLVVVTHCIDFVSEKGISAIPLSVQPYGVDIAYLSPSLPSLTPGSHRRRSHFSLFTMAETEGKFDFAIDRGGTFTDVFTRLPDGRERVLKLLSRDPQNYKDAPTEGIRRVLEEVRWQD